MIEENLIQRTFILGDEWVYYKIYTGSKTSDLILSSIIKPVTQHLLSNGIIDKWFFIRYADPKLHLRLRLHLIQSEALSETIKIFNFYFKQYISQDLIWKIQTDTYQREIERYGANSMELAETFFFYESRMIIKALDFFKGEKGETMRWLFGIRSIDNLLGDFNFNIIQKSDLIKIFADNFNAEFNMNKEAKANLGKKYRKERQQIKGILAREENQNADMLPLFNLIDEKSKETKSIIDEIIALDNTKTLQCPLNELIGSYTHMFCNRLFRSKQRLHELVLYTFLQKYYESEIARKSVLM